MQFPKTLIYLHKQCGCQELVFATLEESEEQASEGYRIARYDCLFCGEHFFTLPWRRD